MAQLGDSASLVGIIYHKNARTNALWDEWARERKEKYVVHRLAARVHWDAEPTIQGNNFKVNQSSDPCIPSCIWLLSRLLPCRGLFSSGSEPGGWNHYHHDELTICRRPRGPMDKASDYESGDSRFESWRGRAFFTIYFVQVSPELVK